jgi:adenylosuccinate synthase
VLGRGQKILLEGAQGTMLDPDFGTYPFVTSSSPMAPSSSIGSGISINKIGQVIGITKAYTTRVGGGPMPTELLDEMGKLIRERAHEYGATTGRPRRCGWFDAVVGRYTSKINGFTGLVLTRLDILDVFPSIKICTGYKLNGEQINYVPSLISDLSKCEPIYEEMPGWQTDLTAIREYKKLPAQAKKFIARIEELLSCPVHIVSIGAKREQTIFRKQIL